MSRRKTVSNEDMLAKVSNLDVMYPFTPSGASPAGYTRGLICSLLADDANGLMRVLDTRDLNPWEAQFANDGLGVASPDKFNIIGLAQRWQSWECAAELTMHFYDCGHPWPVADAAEPAILEYQSGPPLERAAEIEAFLHAVNVGVVRHFKIYGGAELVYHPPFVVGASKANRFIFKDFASLKVEQKTMAPVMSKRLTLRQKVVGAIATRNLRLLADALEALRDNATASGKVNERREDVLTDSELRTFTLLSLACEFEDGVELVISKTVRFQRSSDIGKFAIDRSDPNGATRAANIRGVMETERIFHISKAIDSHLDCPDGAVSPRLFQAIQNAVFDAMSKVEQSVIAKVAKSGQESSEFTKLCVAQACGRIGAMRERSSLAAEIGSAAARESSGGAQSRL